MAMSAKYEEEPSNNNTQLHVTRLNSYNGKSLWFCKHCMMAVRIAELVKGTTRERATIPSTGTTSTVSVDTPWRTGRIEQ